MSFLPGMFPAGAVTVTPPEVTFLQATENTAGLATYTFAGVNFGAADPTRRIIVACHWGQAGASTFTSATIGGIAATTHISVIGTAQGPVALVSALVPTGTSGTVAFTVSVAVDHGMIGVYRSVNETAAPTVTASDNTVSAGVLAATINIPDNGWVIGACGSGAMTTFASDTWTGLNEQYGGVWSDAAGVGRGGGFQSGLPLQASRPVQVAYAAAGLPTAGSLALLTGG